MAETSKIEKKEHVGALSFPTVLRVLFGPDQLWAQRTIGQLLSIGREPGVTWQIADEKMSRAHAQLKPGAVLEDLESTNGVFVNGERVARAQLAPGDIVRLGNTLFEYGPAPVEPRSESSLHAHSVAAQKALMKAERVAPSDLAVVLLGETGTGKEVFARYIHALSRRTGKMLAVNCAALPADLVESTLFGHVKGAFTGATGDAAGVFQEAAGGTLFLDEIGELPMAMQPKLLRVLETGEYSRVGSREVLKADVRIVSATNVVLPEAVRDGRFRADLYARLFGYTIELQPLSERRADIVPLFQTFVSEVAQVTLTADLIETLLVYDWPLNVRELRAVAQRVLLGCKPGAIIDRAELREALALDDDDGVGERDSGGSRQPAPPRDELVRALEESGGNVEAAAAKLGRRRPQVYRWLKRYQLNPSQFRR